MNYPICITFLLTDEDLNALQNFRYSYQELNVLQKLILSFRRKGGHLHVSRTKTPGEPTTCEFGPHDVRLIYQGETDIVSWNLFTSVVEYDKGYLFARNQQMQLVIPKRAFSSDSMQQDFRTLVRRRLQERAKLLPSARG